MTLLGCSSAVLMCVGHISSAVGIGDDIGSAVSTALPSALRLFKYRAVEPLRWHVDLAATDTSCGLERCGEESGQQGMGDAKEKAWAATRKSYPTLVYTPRLLVELEDRSGWVLLKPSPTSKDSWREPRDPKVVKNWASGVMTTAFVWPDGSDSIPKGLQNQSLWYPESVYGKWHFLYVWPWYGHPATHPNTIYADHQIDLLALCDWRYRILCTHPTHCHSLHRR